MDDQKFSLSGSFQKAKEYVDTQIELTKLKALAKAARIGGALVLDATKLLLGLIVIFFISLALGFYLGELMGSNALGFLTTGAFFLLLILIIRVFEPRLEARFTDMTIRKVLAKWNEEDEDVSIFGEQEEKTKGEDTIDKEKTDEPQNH